MCSLVVEVVGGGEVSVFVVSVCHNDRMNRETHFSEILRVLQI